MKNKKLFCIISAALAVMIFASVIFTSTAFASNDTEIIVDYKRGDVNLDGKINIRDASLIQKFIAKLEALAPFQEDIADFNFDGKINVKDATLIQKYIANIIQSTKPVDPEFTIPGTIGETDDEPVVLPFVPAP